MIKIFRGRGGGWRGGSSEGCLKWVVRGHFKGISPKTSKNEVGKERACFLSVQFASDGKLLFLPSILNSSLLSFIDLLKSIKVNLFNKNRSLWLLLCWVQLLSDLMRNASGTVNHECV